VILELAQGLAYGLSVGAVSVGLALLDERQRTKRWEKLEP